MDWIDLAWDRDLRWDFYACGNERPDSIYCGEFCDYLGCIEFSRTVLHRGSYVETCF